MDNHTETWRDIVARIGLVKIAFNLGVTAEVVRQWVKDGKMPGWKNLKLLVNFIKYEVEDDEFARFMASLSRDIFGLQAEPEDREAVNE